MVESTMRAILISLLVFGVCGCGSDDAGTPEQPVSTPKAEKPVSTPTAEQPVDDPKPVAKTPDVSPPVEQPLPDVATVKKTLTSAQLAVGDPIENSIGMVLVPIPAGEFMMGSRLSAADVAKRFEVPAKLFEDEHPRHRVTLTKPFYLGATEVTKGQFRQFVLAENYRTEAETDGKGGFGFNSATGNPEGPDPKYTWKTSGFAQTADHPVVNVSWNDAQAFCKWLSAKEGVTYRLPTEAEWEYACRAGTTSLYHNGDDPEGLVSVGNVLDASAKAQLTEYPDLPYLSANDGYAFTAPVGRFRANPWGLYDLHGNVFEWCQDWYGSYTSGDTADPAGPDSGSHRVGRGGSWNDVAWYCRSAYRSGYTPSGRSDGLGFRVLRSSIK
jgi:formylglycine-generating enzyme required for sulfatase activity